MAFWRPVAALLVVALWILPSFLLAPDTPPGVTPVDLLARRLQPGLAVGVAVLALVALVLRWRGLGLGPPRRGTLRLLCLPALYLALMLGGALALGWPAGLPLGVLAANTLLVGLTEEGLFRGLLYSGLRDAMPPWPAILVTSALFGAAHLGNAAWTGDLPLALIQSVVAGGLGLLLLAIRIRTGSLWPAILLHAAWNFSVILLALAAPEPAPGPAEAVSPSSALPLVGAFLPLLLYGVYILRRVGPEGDGLGRVAAWQPSRVPRVARPRAGEHPGDAGHEGDDAMIDASTIREHAEVIGADGVHVGTVDKVEGDRIKLTKRDAGQGAHEGHHHFVPMALVAEIDDGRVRLSANADVAVDMFEEEEGGQPAG